MELLFVYNAKSDTVNRLIDFAHKIVSPSTYECDLCSLTHSNLGEKKEWKDFVMETNSELKFYHIDDFEDTFNTSFKYPVILKKTNDRIEPLLDHQAIANIASVTDLINTINDLIKAETKI